MRDVLRTRTRGMTVALRPRTRGMTVATLVLAGATLGARYEGRRIESPTLAKSFDADPSEWQDGDASRRIDMTPCGLAIVDDEPVFEAASDLIGAWSGDCVNQDDDDHCFREEFRAQLEAWEAGKSYDEIRAVSPTGVAFVPATPVRRPPPGTVY